MPWFWQAVLLAIFVVPMIILFGYAAMDVFRRQDASPIVKVLWLLSFCLFYIIGPLVYLAIRPPGTTAQQRALAEGRTTTAEQLQALANLYDQGKLTDEEFRAAKAQQMSESGAPSVVPQSVREQRGSQLL